jgi:PAS domain S-box-containing protein
MINKISIPFLNSRSMARQFTRNYLFVSIIPMVLLLIIVIGGTVISWNYLADLVTKSTYDLNKDAELSLQDLGEKIIQAKARDVAKQVEIYFKMYPNMDIREMRKAPLFRDLIQQKVGKTGYMSIYEAPEVIFRVHPNPKYADRSMIYLAKDLPSWWAIVGATRTGKEASGYYDWIDTDGSIRKKYMTCTPVGTRLQGIIMIVAATTYIDEFSAPVTDMKKKADKIVSHYQSYVSRLWMIFGFTAAVLIILTIAGTYFLGRRAAFRYIYPIMHLAEIARRFGEGDWNATDEEGVLLRKDEIGTLAQAFSRMSTQLKELFVNLEQRVNELKQTRDALKESEEHYRSLYDGVPVGLYRTTPEGDVLDVNPTLVHMMGYPDRETFIRLKAHEHYVNPEDRSVWQAKIKESGGITSFETLMRKYDGTEIWMENQSRVVQDENGKVLYYEGSLQNKTERRLAEAALKKSEESFKNLYEESKRTSEVYRSLINSSADAIVIYDLDNRVTYASPMFTNIFGWSLDELLGKEIPFLPESEREATMATIGNVIAKGTPCHGFETKRKTKDGRLIDVSMSASRYDDHEGKPAGMLAILRDISEKKRLEAHLQNIERMEAIGTLAGGIAHDFNNLLMIIQGSISVMLHDMDPSHPYYTNFLNIEKQVQRGAKLTGQLLGYARKGKYELRVININEIIMESMETFRRTRKDINIHYDLAGDIHPIEVDIYQIEQVLMNLFINAFDAMTEGGDLSLKTQNVFSDEIVNKIFEPKPGNYVMFSIKDTGAGMDKKTMDRIFEPFFTTKGVNKGTGLGLSSVYGIVKGHGGYIDVASELGRGSTFSIYIPATDKPITDSHPEPKKAVMGKATILIIDDEELVLDVGTKMLNTLGYKVLKAQNARSALEMYKENHERIDMIILDMIMPGMSGSQAFDLFREINPNVSILLSSGYSIDGKAADIMKRGCNGFIQKPFSLEELSEKIKKIIRDE